VSTPQGESNASVNAPETGRRRTIWPNLVWGIPLAALLIVGYLGARALFNRGEVVTVTFTRAAGAKAGVTKVLYQGIEAGQLVKIEPNRSRPCSPELPSDMRPVKGASPRTDSRDWIRHR